MTINFQRLFPALMYKITPTYERNEERDREAMIREIETPRKRSLFYNEKVPHIYMKIVSSWFTSPYFSSIDYGYCVNKNFGGLQMISKYKKQSTKE